MLNKIINFSLHNRLTVLILTGLVLVFGTIVLVRSEIDIFPENQALKEYAEYLAKRDY